MCINNLIYYRKSSASENIVLIAKYGNKGKSSIIPENMAKYQIVGTRPGILVTNETLNSAS